MTNDRAKHLAQLRQAYESGLLDEETYQVAVAALGHSVYATARDSGAVAQEQGVAAGARGMAVGGSVQGDVSITEFHYHGVEERLGTFQSRTVAHYDLPQPNYTRFIGREAELSHIQELLSPNSRAWIVVVDGIGGVGKSALALEVARRYLYGAEKLPEEERFQAIIWTSAKAGSLTADGVVPRYKVARTLDDIYTAISVTLGREDIIRARLEKQGDLVRRALIRQRTLLIIDNLDTIDDERVNSFLRELPAPTKCIVTTRHRIDVSYPIRLAEMPPDEAQTLIAQECEERNVQLSGNQADLLYQRTGGVPLPIVWAIAQMGYGYGVETVLRRLGTPTDDVTRYCFEGAVDRIQGKPAYDLLVALSLFATDASRAALGKVADLPELDRDEGLVDLDKLSLVNKQSDRFSLLPITRRFAADLREGYPVLAQDCRRRWVEYYTEFVSQYKHRDSSQRALLERERENIIEVIEEVWASGMIQAKKDLLNRFFIFLWRRGHWAEAVRQAKRLLSWARDNQQTDWQARLNHWLGRLYMFQGALDDAELHLLLARELYAEDAWQWISVQTYLAQVDLRRGLPEQAEEILKITLERANQQDGEPGRGHARILNVLAEIRLDAGKVQEALEYSRQAANICERIDLDHVTVAGRSYYLTAQAYLLLEDLETAETWMDRYHDLALEEGFVQETGLAKLGLGRIKYRLKKPHQARELVREAYALFEKIGMPTELELCSWLLEEIESDLGNVTGQL